MKKIFVSFMAILLMVGFASVGYAATSNYASENVDILGNSGGSSGITPVTVVVKVRYACMDADAAKVSSGDVLVWNTTSADGVTISRCIVDSPQTTISFAGVAVSDILTATSATMTPQGREWGYMAIKGYCLAKVDTSESGTGEKLALNGNTLVAAFQTLTTGMPGVETSMSQDIGILLTDTAADGLMKVWLR